MKINSIFLYQEALNIFVLYFIQAGFSTIYENIADGVKKFEGTSDVCISQM